MCKYRHFIGYPHFTRDARANEMIAFAHLSPEDVQIVERVDFVKKNEGNVGGKQQEGVNGKKNAC